MSYYETILERDGYPAEYEPNGYDTCRDCKWCIEDCEAEVPLVTTVRGRLVHRAFCVNVDCMMFVSLDDTTGFSGCTCFEGRNWD